MGRIEETGRIRKMGPQDWNNRNSTQKSVFESAMEEEERTRSAGRWRQLLPAALVVIGLSSPTRALVVPQINQGASVSERARERAYAREQFARHFKSIQVRSQLLLRLHEKRTLTAKQLREEAGQINKSARMLRQLIALGTLASKVEQKASFGAPEEFDVAIRKLANLVWEFAHNPVHQNGKVFNTRQAAMAQTDLLSIIELSRALQRDGTGYQSPKSDRPASVSDPSAGQEQERLPVSPPPRP
jgi:hypothetical protein